MHIQMYIHCSLLNFSFQHTFWNFILKFRLTMELDFLYPPPLSLLAVYIYDLCVLAGTYTTVVLNSLIMKSLKE